MLINVLYIRWWFFDLESVVIVMYCNPRDEGVARTRVSSKQTETRSVSVVFRFVSWKPKTKKFFLFPFVSVFRTYIETTETNRTVSNETENNRNNPKFSEKYQNMLSIKHRNSLFRYRTVTTETNALFWIVPKLVSVPVSVVSYRNSFRRTP